MAGFQSIYEEHGRAVYRFLLALTGEPQQAEELLQETFCQALIHINRFEGRCSLYTWLCQIGKNAWLRECRRRERFADEPVEELPLAAPNTPESDYLQKETLRAIRRAVHDLDEPYKEVFVLHVFGGLKLKEIAAALGKSESWARVTYHRAKQRILKEVNQ